MTKKKNPLYSQWFGSRDSHPKEHGNWRHGSGHRPGEKDNELGFGTPSRHTRDKGLMFPERRGRSRLSELFD